MAHVQYYLQYKDQPFLFQSEALPGDLRLLLFAIVKKKKNKENIF
jgi:hypothetical protein